MENRLKIILKTSVIGIVVNVFLALFKIVIGTISKSVAVVSDGINNFADAASSIITMVGARLAGKPADKKHPFGYGRIEYLSALLISALVLYAGITAFVDGIKNILHPETPEYSTVTLIIIAVAIVIKLALALYTQKQGKAADSDSLTASGKEAILDVMVSVATLVAALVYTIFGLSLEAYLATLIALLIIKTGIEGFLGTVSRILGEPAEVELVVNLKKEIASFDGVSF